MTRCDCLMPCGICAMLDDSEERTPPVYRVWLAGADESTAVVVDCDGEDVGVENAGRFYVHDALIDRRGSLRTEMFVRCDDAEPVYVVVSLKFDADARATYPTRAA